MASSPKVARGREWELSPRGREVKRLLEGKRPAQQLFDKKAPTVEQGQSWRSDLGIQDICSEMVTHKQRARERDARRLERCKADAKAKEYRMRAALPALQAVHDVRFFASPCVGARHVFRPHGVLSPPPPPFSRSSFFAHASAARRRGGSRFASTTRSPPRCGRATRARTRRRPRSSCRACRPCARRAAASASRASRT